MLDPGDFLVCPRSKQPMEKSGAGYIAPCGFTYPNGDFRVTVDYSPRWSEGQDAYEEWGRQYRKDHDAVPARMAAVDASFQDVYEQISLEGLVLDVAADVGTVVTQAGIDPERYAAVDTARIDFAHIRTRLPPTTRATTPGHDTPRSSRPTPSFCPSETCTSTRFTWACLDHFTAPHIALSEAYRVLRPEGSLVVGLALEGAYHHNVVFLAAAKRQPEGFGPTEPVHTRHVSPS